MLKQEDNELITRVGPGTPMGNLMREYWVRPPLKSLIRVMDVERLGFARWLVENQHLRED